VVGLEAEMGNKKAAALAAIVILLGLSVVLTESKVLAYLPANWWLRLLEPVRGLLIAVAGFLSWKYYKQSHNIFFKLLAFALFFSTVMELKDLLFSIVANFHLAYPGQFSIHPVIRLVQILFQQAGAFLFAILLVHAIRNYGVRERSVTLQRGFLLLLVVFSLLWVTWAAYTMLRSDLNRSFDLTTIFIIVHSVLLTVIYLDGIRIAMRKKSISENWLLKSLVTVMAMEIFLSLTWVFPFFVLNAWLGTTFSVIYNYTTMFISIAIPVLFVAGLVACGKECRGESEF